MTNPAGIDLNCTHGFTVVGTSYCGQCWCDLLTRAEKAERQLKENKKTDCPWGEWHYVIPLSLEDEKEAEKEEEDEKQPYRGKK